MVNIIPVTWYFESPIDFEQKQYVLLSYLQKVDSSFLKKKLSPHLLHMESMLFELNNYLVSYNSIINVFNNNRYQYLDNPKLVNEDNLMIDEIREIILFSIPQIKCRVDLGYKILENNKQILF